jgi:hypothetical protein
VINVAAILRAPLEGGAHIVQLGVESSTLGDFGRSVRSGVEPLGASQIPVPMFGLQTTQPPANTATRENSRRSAVDSRL